MDRPEFKGPIDANYVLVHVDVQESGDKQETVENPGGRQLMAALGGAKSGLPFYAVLDPRGKKLADSNRMPGGANIGYPGAAEEISAFGKLLQDSAPRLSSADRNRMVAYLQDHTPGH